MRNMRNFLSLEGRHGHPFKRVVWTSAAAGSASPLQVSLMRVTNKGRRDEKNKEVVTSESHGCDIKATSLW